MSAGGLPTLPGLHLDYFSLKMEAYRACKVKLFEQLNLTGGTGIFKSG